MYLINLIFPSKNEKIGENWIYNGGKVVVYGEGSVRRREKEEEIKIIRVTPFTRSKQV